MAKYKNETFDTIITGTASADTITNSGDWTATYSSSKNIIAFKVGSITSAITLKNFTATNFNVNGEYYAISGKKLVKQ